MRAGLRQFATWKNTARLVAGEESGGFDGGLVDQHDGDVIFDPVDAVAAGALQGFGILAVLESLLAGGADQNIQQIFGDHGENCTRKGREGRGDSVRFYFRRRNGSSNFGWQQDRE